MARLGVPQGGVEVAVVKGGPRNQVRRPDRRRLVRLDREPAWPHPGSLGPAWRRHRGGERRQASHTASRLNAARERQSCDRPR
jgi:hypothetical protein